MIELDIESGASVHAPSCGCSAPEVVLPGQFYATVRSQRAGERERLLMLAVLEDAITCYQRYARARGPAARQLFEDARAWLESEDRSVLFSFESICDALEISPGFVRRRLHEWEKHHAPLPRPAHSVTAEPGRRRAAARRGRTRVMRHATGQGRSVASVVERA
jgi:hypothetical protein